MKLLDYRKKPLDDVEKALRNRLKFSSDAEQTVKKIIEDVRSRGDAALFEYTKKFDGTDLSANTVRISKDEISAAAKSVPESIGKILQDAAENIRRFHRMQLPECFEIDLGSGSYAGQRILPLSRVALYVPGGKAAYPSTLLMNAIPAQIAGVKDICLITPPDKEGNINPYVLYAADFLGIDEIYRIGGAQAVASVAYGTESIRRVDKIVGPGNQYVALAKKNVFGDVAIDMIAGPSEVLVIADASANPDFIAADLLAQAEHDEQAGLYLITTDATLPERVMTAIEAALKKLSRAPIARVAVENGFYAILVDDMDCAFDAANAVAAEHVELAFENAGNFVDRITNAGSIFIGHYTPEALGDYYAGPNHTLPTSATARYASPLGVYDFIKRPTYLYYSESQLESVYKDVAQFAAIEGLTAHRYAVDIRFDPEYSKK
jgi:histidinol dehydrogenase